MKPGTVNTGRIDARRHCEGCGNRIKYGDPRPTEAWPYRLRLTKEQHELLLVAAAEFMEIGGGTPVEFLDWCAVESLGGATHDFPKFDGRSVMESGGGRPGAQLTRQSSPFPLPRMRS